MVTPEPPVKTVKKAHTPAQATAVPPGSQPNQPRNTPTSRSAARPSASRKPATVNSGMEARKGDTESW
jgi:hypothetical protein